MNATREHLLILTGGQDAVSLMIIDRIRGYTCTFCGGEGHHARVCASKRILDEESSALGLRGGWALVKGSVIKDNVEAHMLVKQDLADTDRQLHIRQQEQRQHQLQLVEQEIQQQAQVLRQAQPPGQQAQQQGQQGPHQNAQGGQGGAQAEGVPRQGGLFGGRFFSRSSSTMGKLHLPR